MSLVASRIRMGDINTLNRNSGRFNAAFYEGVKEAASSNRYNDKSSTNLVIHPLFCPPYLSDPGKVFLNGWVEMEIRDHETDKNSEHRYSAYLKRLEDHLKQTLAPIFIFAQPEQRLSIDLWVAELQPKAPVVMLSAESDNATPIFGSGKGKEKAWQLFGDILKDVGIQHPVLIGERAYREDGVGAGCLYVAFHYLVKMISPITVEKGLTYPNFDVPRWEAK